MQRALTTWSVILALAAGATPLGRAQEAAPGRVPAIAVSRDMAPAGARNPASSEVDLRALRPQLQSLQSVLNRSVQQSFDHPFVLLQDAKGIYLPRFGVAFHMEVNLYPLRILSPFDPRPYSPEELAKAKQSKLARIHELKERLQQVLLEHAAELEAIPSEQNVAVVVHLFNLPSEQSDDLPIQLVIGASRRTLLDFQAHRLTAEDFRNREFSLEF